jgi:DNA gyrase inhibitor GyrI
VIRDWQRSPNRGKNNMGAAHPGQVRITDFAAVRVAALEYRGGKWLAHSGERLRDFPSYLQRVHFFPEVPPHEAAVDVFLPLR